MKNKFNHLIDLCKRGITLTSYNIGDNMFLVDRGTFQLVIPNDNTNDHGDFFVYAIKGHDCYSYNSESTHIYHIIEGTGKFIIDNEIIDVKPGDTITIETNKIFTYIVNMILTFEMMPNFKEENDHFVGPVNYENNDSISEMKK